MTDRRGHLIGSAIVVVALAAVALSAALPALHGDREARSERAFTVDPGDSPFAAATKMLGAQARALLAGDEDGWLASVDQSQPTLRATYRSMYASLRALDVTQFQYQPLLLGGETDPTLAIDGKIAYCFTDCSLSGGAGIDPPDAHQHLKVRMIGGWPVITDMVQYEQDDHLAPAPWETGPLVVKRGDRVTVAAPPSEAAHLDEVLSMAERGTAVADRFAAGVGNPQRRYRIFLADDASWKNWYGGRGGAGVAYTMPLPLSGADIIVRTDELVKDPGWMPFVVRSQLGRVVALGQQLTPRSGYDTPADDIDWLADGVAQWVGSWPEPARSGPWASDVRTLMHSPHPPTTIVASQLATSADAETVRQSFGFGQFTVDCLVAQYGEPAFFAFAKGVLQQQVGPGNAATSAFHKSFPQVDQGCLKWIREQAG